jgi:hypothetical protein
VTTRCFKIDPLTGDIVHDGRRLQRVADLEAIAQSLRTRLATFKGEWFLDENYGVPWFQTILGTKIPQAAIREVFRKVIAETPGVAQILKLELRETSVAREFVLAFTVSTDLGELSLSVPTGV